MPTLDLSPEAVERLAAHVQSTCGCALGPNAEQSVARTLRVLSAERERLLSTLRLIGGKGNQVYCRDGHEECALLARAALNQETPRGRPRHRRHHPRWKEPGMKTNPSALRALDKLIEDACPSEFDDEGYKGYVRGLREARAVLADIQSTGE